MMKGLLSGALVVASLVVPCSAVAQRGQVVARVVAPTQPATTAFQASFERGLISSPGAAPHAAKLTYLGTSGWSIETSEGTVVIDYVGQDSSGLNIGQSMSVLRPQDVVRKPAIVVVTHEHEDHYSAAFRQWSDSLRYEIFAAGGTVPLRAGDVR
jgi:hypothetical protein